MTPTQLKDWVRNRARTSGVNPQLIMRYYMLEKVLEKIAASPYQHAFVLKGGFLIGSLLGVERRTTMDLDATLRDFAVSQERIVALLADVFATPTAEGITFTVTWVEEIREQDNYPGFRAHVKAELGTLRADVKLDFTTGDTIHPEAIRYAHPLLFEDRAITVYAYPVEQILAEKLQTLLYLAEDNTRARDFYDIYLLVRLKPESFQLSTLAQAVAKTFWKRGMGDSFPTLVSERLPVIRSSDRLRAVWDRYARNLPEGPLSYAEVVSAVADLCATLLTIPEEDWLPPGDW